ncbi:MAG: sporulation protein YqfD [Oscillospiraceae bacterium]
METVSDTLTGYAVVRAVGAEPTALLSRLAKENIEFWAAEPTDECTICFRVRLADAGRVLRLAEKCCCDAVIERRAGAPEELKKLKRRRVLCVLPLLLFALLIWSSFHVWRIDVTGNKTVPTTAILNALDESGVRIGAYWPAFKSDVIRAEVRVKLPALKWVSVSVHGSRALVVVREATPEMKPFDEKTPVKLVASMPGYIDQMEICRGFAKFQKGQAAFTGETLADGAVPDALGGIHLVHARGAVIAETYQELTAELPLTTLEKRPTGRERTRLALLFGRKRINFYKESRIFGGNCDTIIKVHKLGVEGLFELPAAFVTETRQAYTLEETAVSEDDARARLQALLESELKRRIGADGEIESAEYSYAVVDGYAVVTLRAHCRQNIAEEQPMTEAEIAEAQAAAKPKEENKTE